MDLFVCSEFCFVCGIASDDSHRALMQIIYPAHVIAAAAFYFARKFTHTQIRKNPDGKEWWEQYGVRIEDLRGIRSKTPVPANPHPQKFIADLLMNDLFVVGEHVIDSRRCSRYGGCI